jgi:hypothetical protein
VPAHELPIAQRDGRDGTRLEPHLRRLEGAAVLRIPLRRGLGSAGPISKIPSTAAAQSGVCSDHAHAPPQIRSRQTHGSHTIPRLSVGCHHRHAPETKIRRTYYLCQYGRCEENRGGEAAREETETREPAVEGMSAELRACGTPPLPQPATRRSNRCTRLRSAQQGAGAADHPSPRRGASSVL